MKILKAVFSKDSEMFEMTSQSKFIPNLVISLLVFFILWIVGRFLAILVLTIPLSFFSDGNIIMVAVAKSIRLAFIGGTIISLFLMWVRYIEKRPIHTIGLSSNKAARKYFVGFMIGITFMAANTLAFFVLGVAHFEGFYFEKHGINIVVSVFIMLFGYMVQSASEEIAVRGWLLPIIGAKYNAMVAVLVTSTMFGVIHLLNPNVTALSIINIVLAGVFMALIVILQGDIWSVCGYHCGWNWALANVFGYQISGYAPVGGALFNLRLEGSELLTGGYFGPEAGIIATVFLLFGIFVLTKMIYRKKSAEMRNKNGEYIYSL